MNYSFYYNLILLMFLLNIVFSDALTCQDILQMPSDTKLTISDLQTIQSKEIVECLAHLGKEQLEAEEADFIWMSIINFYEGIQNIPDKVLMILHYVTVAVKPEDYGNITLSNIDVIENFGLDYGLNQEQLGAIADRVREDFAGKEPEDYTYYDLMAMKHILCQFNRSEIERIHPSAYREAALMVGKLKNCGTDVMSGFASLAMHPSAFGPIDNWTEITLKTMGTVADFLPKDIIRRVKTNSDKAKDKDQSHDLK